MAEISHRIHGVTIYMYLVAFLCCIRSLEPYGVASDTPHNLIYYDELNDLPKMILKAREIACRLEGSRVSSLVTPALTVAWLEPR